MFTEYEWITEEGHGNYSGLSALGTFSVTNITISAWDEIPLGGENSHELPIHRKT